MTSWLAVVGLTAMLFDVAALTPTASVVKAMFISSALLYDRPVKVATPLTSVTREAAALQGRRPVGPAGRGHDVRAVADDDVAVRVLELDDRLGREHLGGGRRGRGLLGDDQAGPLGRADDDARRGGRGEVAAAELEREGLGRVVAEVGERGDAAHDRGGERPLERARAGGERGGARPWCCRPMTRLPNWSSS